MHDNTIGSAVLSLPICKVAIVMRSIKKYPTIIYRDTGISQYFLVGVEVYVKPLAGVGQMSVNEL